MNTRRYLALVTAGVLAVAVSSNAMASDRRTNNTLLGVGLGAVAGAVLSEGSPLLTLSGAAAGGLLGNILTEDRRGHDRHYRNYSQRGNHRYVQERYDHRRSYRGHGHRGNSRYYRDR